MLLDAACCLLLLPAGGGQEAEPENDRMGMRGEEEKDEVDDPRMGGCGEG